MPELTITSNPPLGEVSINGVSIGTAPVTITVGERPEPPSYILAFIESFDTFAPPSMSLDFTETFDE